VATTSTKNHFSIASLVVEADVDEVALVIKTNVEVSQEDLSKAVLLDLIIDALETNKALSLSWKLVEISLGSDFEFSLSQVEANIGI